MRRLPPSSTVPSGWLSAALGLVLTVSAPSPTHAQEPQDPLGEMREDFLSELATASAPVDEIYIKALRDLELQMAAERDYETALEAQRRRTALESSKPAAGNSAESGWALLPGNARTTGRISKEGGTANAPDVLASWKTVGSSAIWEVQNTVPGTYLVRIHYACGEPAPFDADGDSIPESFRSAGGTLVFEEMTNLAGAAENRLRADVKSTGGWSTYTVMDLGEIRLQRSSATFRIVAAEVEPLGLMNLRRIDIIPKIDDDASAPATPKYGEPTRLTETRENHYARLGALREPIAQAYIEDLRALAANIPAADREAIDPVIDSEIARASEVARASPPVAGRGAEPDTAYRGKHQPPDLTPYHGARWTDDPMNRGDAFMVEHGGKRFPVRLIFVTCPTPDSGDDESAAYFGISREQSGIIGRDASQFTAKYLEGRDLTLLATGDKDVEGNTLVIVSLKGFGTYARILVARGLAMINPNPTATPRNRRSPDEYVKSSLRPVEERAKSEGRGAWSFGNRPDPPRNPGSPPESKPSERPRP